MYKTILTILSFVIFSTSFSANGQTVDGIIKKHFAAIGGADNWRKIKTIKTTGSFISSEGSEVVYTSVIADNIGVRKEFTYPSTGMTAFIIVTPTAGWSFIPITGMKTSAKPVPSDVLERAQYQLRIQSPLLDYKAKGNKVALVGKEKVKDTECFKLKVTDKTGAFEFIYIDAVNYYHIRTTHMTAEHGTESEEEIKAYADFQKLPEGIVYPMTLDEGIGAQHVKSVEINPAVDSKIFVP